MSNNPATENPNDKMPPGRPLDDDTAVSEGDGGDATESGIEKVGPEDEDRNFPNGEPSAEQAVKDQV